MSDGDVSKHSVCIKPSVKLTKGQWPLDRSTQPTAHSTSLYEQGMLAHYHLLWVGALPSATLLPRANHDGGSRSAFESLRGGEIGSWKPANLSTDL